VMPTLPWVTELQRINQTLGKIVTSLIAPGDLRISTYYQLCCELKACLDTGQSLGLSGSDEGHDAEFVGEVDRYRLLLLRLQSILPPLHARLLCHRSLLDSQRRRLEALGAWTQASKQTL